MLGSRICRVCRGDGSRCACRPPGTFPVQAVLAQWPERGPDLGGEQLGLFPGCEVAALFGLVEVGEGGVELLDPAARGRPDLAGEGGEADGDRDLRGSLPG